MGPNFNPISIKITIFVANKTPLYSFVQNVKYSFLIIPEYYKLIFSQLFLEIKLKRLKRVSIKFSAGFINISYQNYSII